MHSALPLTKIRPGQAVHGAPAAVPVGTAWRQEVWTCDVMPVRLRSKKNSPKNPVLCYKDFTQRLNTKGKFGLCRILTHCSPKR